MRQPDRQYSTAADSPVWVLKNERSRSGGRGSGDAKAASRDANGRVSAATLRPRNRRRPGVSGANKAPSFSFISILVVKLYYTRRPFFPMTDHIPGSCFEELGQ